MTRWIVLFGILPFTAAAQHRLTVNVEGLKSDKGTVDAALHSRKEAFPTKPAQAGALTRSAIQGGKAALVFENVAPGVYAVAVYHDVNGNGKLDTNFIGIPKEPTGSSNDAKAKMGPPKFEDARFTLSGDMTITVKIQ